MLSPPVSCLTLPRLCRKYEKRRELQQQAAEEAKRQSDANVDAAGLRQFGVGQAEAADAAFKAETVRMTVHKLVCTGRIVPLIASSNQNTARSWHSSSLKCPLTLLSVLLRQIGLVTREEFLSAKINLAERMSREAKERKQAAEDAAKLVYHAVHVSSYAQTDV